MEAPLIHFDETIRRIPHLHDPIVRALRNDVAPFQAMMQRLAAARLPSQQQVLTCGLAYAACGQQVFCIGPRMQEMFAATDCNEVPLQFIKMPFPCFYVALPDCQWRIFGDERTGMHRVAGFYLLETSPGHLVLLIWSHPNEKSEGLGDEALFWVAVGLEEVPGVEKGGVLAVDFERYLRNVFADPTKGDHDRGITYRAEGHAETAETAAKVMRVAVNFMLYLASKGCEVRKDTTRLDAARQFDAKLREEVERKKNPRKRRRALKAAAGEAEKHSAATILWIGQTIEASREKEHAAGDGDKGAWRVRRGHWHNFWTGPRRNPDGSHRPGDELVLHWILPVYRSVSDSPRQYRLAEERDDWK